MGITKLRYTHAFFAPDRKREKTVTCDCVDEKEGRFLVAFARTEEEQEGHRIVANMACSEQPRRITVLIVRHGEREDEVRSRGIHGGHGNLSRAEKIDPSLTVVGHKQALAALTNLFSTLDGQRVAVFSSPLKRCVGTALMIATRARSQWASFQQESSVIPIVIMNGLCDCAAQIQREGGAAAAVQKGLVDCAATDSTIGCGDDPMTRALRPMTALALRAVASSDDKHDLARIQFLRSVPAQNNVDGHCFEPMTQPISLRSPSVASTDEESTISHSAPEQIMRPSVDAAASNVKEGDDFFSALKLAVTLTAWADCDTCVVLAHREGIRALAQSKCHYTGRLSTPYCCIGAFHAEIKSSTKIRWTFHGVSPYSEFGRHSLPTVPSRETLGCTTKVILAIPGEQHVTICIIQSSQSNSPNDIKLGTELSITEYQSYFEFQQGAGLPKVYECDIMDGRRQWSHFMRYLLKREKVAIGAITQVKHDGSKVQARVALDFCHQPNLPFPPYSLRLLLL